MKRRSKSTTMSKYRKVFEAQLVYHSSATYFLSQTIPCSSDCVRLLMPIAVEKASSTGQNLKPFAAPVRHECLLCVWFCSNNTRTDYCSLVQSPWAFSATRKLLRKLLGMLHSLSKKDLADAGPFLGFQVKQEPRYIFFIQEKLA